MQIAEVVGTVVSTQKNRKLEGAKLLLVQPLTLEGAPRGTAAVATRAADRDAERLCPGSAREAHPRSYRVRIVYGVHNPDDRGVHRRGLAAERIARSFALDHNQDLLADAGPDRVNRQ